LKEVNQTESRFMTE